MTGLTLELLARWFVLSSIIYYILGIYGILDYNGRRGDSTLGFLLSQGLSAVLIILWQHYV